MKASDKQSGIRRNVQSSPDHTDSAISADQVPGILRIEGGLEQVPECDPVQVGFALALYRVEVPQQLAGNDVLERTPLLSEPKPKMTKDSPYIVCC